MKLFFIYLFIALSSTSYSIDTLKIMTYNLLNYPGTDTTSRNPFFRTIIEATNPDILVVQEMHSQAGVDGFLNNVMNSVFPNTYSSGVFIDGPDTDRAVFYKHAKIYFVSNIAIPTPLRDINEFKFYHTESAETLRIFGLHLKASNTQTDRDSRTAEVAELRLVTNSFPTGKNFIVLGDFNIYGSTEAAYQNLLVDNVNDDGNFIDQITLTGSWNDIAYAQFHTQSPRVRQFGGGATGGLDDRFDMILYSNAVRNPLGVTYVPNSYLAFGNDGNHFNDSINRPPNTAVSQTIANALHNASDHIPVIAKFQFMHVSLPVELTSFNATSTNNSIILNWKTATETQNYGWEIQRSKKISNHQNQTESRWENIVFVSGAGNSNSPNEYAYIDNSVLFGEYSYRLRQIDFDGSYEYSQIIKVNFGEVPKSFNLINFPNPFNPNTNIQIEIPFAAHVKLKVYDVNGQLVITLADEFFETGIYRKEFDGTYLSSGIYYLVLQTGDIRISSKMLLIK
ncbi:MAG: hypothetical protein C0425_09145 [Chlorobiaceae bacterium]|nr:hypothetical protein [Chlorobiaceae bacterium]MBA4310488.1 hypothetical protein [Chlorobiaceae bacterium]